MMKWKLFGRKRLWCNRGTGPVFVWRETEKVGKNNRMTGVSVVFRTQHLQNAKGLALRQLAW
jgi:hypothetical protein